MFDKTKPYAEVFSNGIAYDQFGKLYNLKGNEVDLDGKVKRKPKKTKTDAGSE